MTSETQISIPEARIIEFIDHLKDIGMIKFKKQLFDKTGIRRQHYIAVRSGRVRFTTDQIQAICDNYPVNANWIFGVDEKMFRNSK